MTNGANPDKYSDRSSESPLLPPYSKIDPLKVESLKVESFKVDQNVFDFMKKHPYSAYMFGSVIFRTRGLGKEPLRIPFTNVKLPFRKRPVIEKIIEQLRLMGLPEMVNSIYEQLPTDQNEGADQTASIKTGEELLNYLHDVVLASIYKKIEETCTKKPNEPDKKYKNSEEKELQENRKRLKNEAARLEKMMRQYADEIGAERKYRLDEIEGRLKRLNNEKKKLSKKQKETLEKLQRIIELNKKQKTENGAGQQYVDIDSDCAKLLEPELPTLLKIFIEFAALIVAVGQGLVAGFFLINTFPMWFALGVCATAGFIVNYFLFKGDFSNLLKEIYINGPSGFFKDEDGKLLSRPKIAAISIAGVSCIAAAIAVGFITFNSVQGTLIGMLALASISSPLGAAIAGGIIAIFTTMCLGALLFMGINKFIKDDGYKEICEYFKKDFYDVWKYNGEKPWDKLAVHEKLTHVSKQALIAFGNLLLLLLKLTPAIIVFFAVRGLFHTQAVKAMTSLFHLNTHVAHTIAYIIVDGLGTVANGFLYPKGIITMLNVIQESIKKCLSFIYSFIKNPSGRYKDITNYFYGLKKNNKTLLIAIIAIFVVVLPILLACIALNSFGQAFGALTSGVSTSVHRFFPFPKILLTIINENCLGLSSAGLNTSSSYAAVKLPSKFNTLFSAKDENKNERKNEVPDSSSEKLYQNICTVGASK